METVVHVVKLVAALGLLCLVAVVVTWTLGQVRPDRQWDKTTLRPEQRPLEFLRRDG